VRLLLRAIIGVGDAMSSAGNDGLGKIMFAVP
jgi:hypothetical protein